MATLEQLQRALVNADAAGDAEGAAILAREIESMRSAQPLVDSYVSGDSRNTAFGRVDALIRGAADVLTISLADEIAAGLGTGFGYLGDYDKELARQRAIDISDEQNRPASRIAGQVGGALLTAAAAGPSRLAPFTAKLGTSAPLWQRVAAGSAEGLGAGAAYGYGSGEGGVGERAANIIPTAAAGGVVGGLAPVVGAGAGKAYEAFRNYRAAAPIAKTVGASPEALRIVGYHVGPEIAPGGAGYGRMMASGPEAMLADVGPGASNLLDSVIANSVSGARIGTERVGERVSRDSDALVSALDTYMGKPGGVVRSQNEIRNASRSAVNDAYELAESLPIDYASEAGKRVEDVINRIPNRYKSQAIQKANERLVYDGKPNLQIMADIADDGTVSFRQMPNVAQANAIKKSLDEVVREGTDPVTGKLSPDAQFAAQIAKDLRNAVSDAVPEYRVALETAADPLSRQEAIRTGYTLLSPSVTRDQAELAIDGMTRPEREALNQGIRSHIDDVMANVTRTAADDDVAAREALKAVKSLSSRASREKLEMALGKEEADALMTEIDRVGNSFSLQARVATNSKTAGRLSTKEAIRNIAAPGFIRNFMAGELSNATKSIAQALSGETPRALSAREDALAAEIADIMTRQGVDAPALYNAIQRIGQTDAKTSAVNAAIARALSGPQISYPASIAAGQWQQR